VEQDFSSKIPDERYFRYILATIVDRNIYLPKKELAHSLFIFSTEIIFSTAIFFLNSDFAVTLFQNSVTAKYFAVTLFQNSVTAKYFA